MSFPAGMTSLRYLHALHSMLQQQGYSPDALLEGSDVSTHTLQHTHGFLEYLPTQNLIHNALKLTGNPHLGLLFGQTLNVSSHGAIGIAALTAANLREAIQVGITYFPLVTTLFTPDFSEAEDHACLTLTPMAGIDDATERFALETLISSIEVMVDFLIGKRVGTSYIEFPWQADPFLQQLIAHHWHDDAIVFRFNAPHYRIVFPGAALTIPFTLANTHSHARAVQDCIDELAQLTPPANLSQRIDDYIRQHPGTPPQMERFAAALGMSSRTLLRQLKQEGTTWRAQVSQCRIALAKQALLERKSVTDTAFMLGYGDSANFTRAFKRETGLSPSAFVRQSPPA